MPKDHEHKFLKETLDSETLKTELAEIGIQELTEDDLNCVSGGTFPAFFNDEDMGNIIAPDGSYNTDTHHIKLFS